MSKQNLTLKKKKQRNQDDRGLGYRWIEISNRPPESNGASDHGSKYSYTLLMNSYFNMFISNI